MGEWVMGLPAHWTSPEHTANVPPIVTGVDGPFRGVSMFSGIASLDLGVLVAIVATVLVEKDEAAKKVLRRRMQDQQLPEIELVARC